MRVPRVPGSGLRSCPIQPASTCPDQRRGMPADPYRPKPSTRKQLVSPVVSQACRFMGWTSAPRAERAKEHATPTLKHVYMKPRP
eukprot:696607-Rhodomonas_salina.4